MSEYKAYIADEDSFSIVEDIIDDCKSICIVNGTNKLDGMYSYYVRGKANNLCPEGRLYLTENCFKTKKGAINRLKNIIKNTIDENSILIENLTNENNKLYKIMEDLDE